jgi:glycosyltransferase involved in cell wall biosynthesis
LYSDHAYEILVVDQTPDTNLPEFARSKLHAWHAQKQIRWIRKDKPNLPAARNTALTLATGEVVLFVDDDVLIPSHFIEQHRQYYLDNSAHIIAVAGQVLNRQDTSTPDELSLEHPYRGTTARFPDELQVTTSWPYLAGGNHSVLRDVAMSIGGYDEHFVGTGFYEDSDFTFRLVAGRYGNILYDPKAWVIHLKAFSGGCRINSYDTQSEIQYLSGTFLYWFRYPQPRSLLRQVYYFLRAGPFRQENIQYPHRQAMAWQAFVQTLRYASKARNQIKSPFI